MISSLSIPTKAVMKVAFPVSGNGQCDTTSPAQLLKAFLSTHMVLTSPCLMLDDDFCKAETVNTQHETKLAKSNSVGLRP